MREGRAPPHPEACGSSTHVGQRGERCPDEPRASSRGPVREVVLGETSIDLGGQGDAGFAPLARCRSAHRAPNRACDHGGEARPESVGCETSRPTRVGGAVRVTIGFAGACDRDGTAARARRARTADRGECPHAGCRRSLDVMALARIPYAQRGQDAAGCERVCVALPRGRAVAERVDRRAVPSSPKRAQKRRESKQGGSSRHRACRANERREDDARVTACKVVPRERVADRVAGRGSSGQRRPTAQRRRAPGHPVIERDSPERLPRVEEGSFVELC